MDGVFIRERREQGREEEGEKEKRRKGIEEEWVQGATHHSQPGGIQTCDGLNSSPQAAGWLQGR